MDAIAASAAASSNRCDGGVVDEVVAVAAVRVVRAESIHRVMCRLSVR